MAVGRGAVAESVQGLGLVRILLPLDEGGRIGIGDNRASGDGGASGGGSGGGCCGGTPCDLVWKAELSALDLLGNNSWFVW